VGPAFSRPVYGCCRGFGFSGAANISLTSTLRA